MAGSISLSLSQQFDALGKPLSGGYLYFFQAGTTATPQNAFQDTGLTIPHPNPIILDSAGRVPAFYLSDGQIKIRLTDKNGVDQIVADNLLVIGPSSGGGGGGGVDPTTVMQTGQMVLWYGTGTQAGFVRCNGRTIGSATSSATERANADTQALFTYLWGADANLAVSGGRGASAAADWAANKTIVLPDLRGRVIAGMDDMGSSAAGRLTSSGFGASATTLGQANSGNNGQTVTLTPNLIPTISSGVSVSVSGSISGTTGTVIVAGQGAGVGGGGAFGVGGQVGVTGTFSGSGSGSATSNNTGGSSTSIPNVQPTMVATIYIHL